MIYVTFFTNFVKKRRLGKEIFCIPEQIFYSDAGIAGQNRNPSHISDSRTH